MSKTIRFIGFLCVILLCACKPQYDHKGKTPLVEVAGNFLYEEDLRLALPLNLSSQDSALFVERFIRYWVEEALLYHKAEGNIPDNERVAKLVDSYRRSLIMHTYQTELVNQQLSEEIAEEEIADYYEKNKTLFLLEEPIVKGLFIKVPLQSPGLSDVRKWYKKNSQETIEKLEKYSLRNAVTYDYFYDYWKPFKDIVSVMPIKEAAATRDYLDSHRDVELKDTAYHYFLHVEDYQGIGKQKPLDFVREEIKEILINLKRVDFINKVKDDLYQKASENNQIIYYYLDSDE